MVARGWGQWGGVTPKGSRREPSGGWNYCESESIVVVVTQLYHLVKTHRLCTKKSGFYCMYVKKSRISKNERDKYTQVTIRQMTRGIPERTYEINSRRTQHPCGPYI